MKNPVLGSNLIQSFLDFETIAGKFRWGIEGPDQRMFCETSSGKVYLTDTSGYQCADVINEISSGSGVTIDGVLLKDTSVNFSGKTPAYSAYTIAGTGGRNAPFINMGSWDAPMNIVLKSDHYVPIQVNLKNTGNVAFDVAAARFRVDTGGATANVAHNVLELRATVGHNVNSVAVVQASASFSTMSVTSGEVVIGYFSFDGAGNVTLPGSNCASAIVGSVTNTGTPVGTVNVAYFRSAASTSVTNMIKVDNLGNATIGATFTGSYSCVLQLGTSGTKLALTSATDRVMSAYTTSAVATAATLSSATIAQTMTAASAVNSVEALQVSLTSNVQTGNWANAISAKIDYSTVGYVTGLAGVICSELDMPGGAVAGGNGTYACYEAELNLPTSYSGGGVPTMFFSLNVWGAQKAQFDTAGYFFDLNGVSVASGKIFQANTAGAATHALRCRINGTNYYLMLTNVGA
jgi:hypothetical protein